MKSLFGRVDRNLLAERGTPDFTGVHLATSAQSLPIPLMWGTRRIAPNILWQGANPAIPFTADYPGGTLPRDVVVYAPDNVAAPGPGNGYAPSFISVPPYPPGSGLAGWPAPGGWQGALIVVGGTMNTPGGAIHGIGGGAFIGGHNFAIYGDEDAASVNSTWWVPAIMGLCEGPINAVQRIWNGSGAAPIVVTGWTSGVIPTPGGATGPYSRTIALPSLFYTLFTGSSSQTTWGYFPWANGGTGSPFTGGQYYPNQDLAYRNTAYIASALVDCGHNNSPPQQAFEVVRTPNNAYRLIDSYGIGYDYSLADIIPDLLTNATYGAGFTLGDIDSTSLTAFTQYQIAQGIFLSPLLTAQSPIVDLINRWAILSNSWICWNGISVQFVPLGDETITANGQTYTPDTTPAYNLGMGDFLTPVVVDRADPIDCYNRVRLEMCDRAASYAVNPIEWKDSTLINQFGLRDASNIDGHDVCDVLVAAKIVELAGKRMAYVRNHYSFTLSYRYIRLLPGTIVTLTDPNLGLNLLPVRVKTIDENDKGELAIVAEEYSGVLGISRPMPAQTWSQSAGGVGGTSGNTSGGAPAPGVPVATSGGVLVMDNTITMVLFVAGDLITLPPDPLVSGRVLTFLHDQLRSPQPTPAILEDNPVTFQRPASGAAYHIVDPSDGTLAPATSVRVSGPSGLTVQFVSDGAGLLRCIQ